MTWYKRLKSRRIDLDLTREEAAELIGVAEVTYGRWERGENLPLPAFQKMIGQAFEINELDIFEEEDEMEVDDE